MSKNHLGIVFSLDSFDNGGRSSRTQVYWAVTHSVASNFYAVPAIVSPKWLGSATVLGTTHNLRQVADSVLVVHFGMGLWLSEAALRAQVVVERLREASRAAVQNGLAALVRGQLQCSRQQLLVDEDEDFFSLERYLRQRAEHLQILAAEWA